MSWDHGARPTKRRRLSREEAKSNPTTSDLNGDFDPDESESAEDNGSEAEFTSSSVASEEGLEETLAEEQSGDDSSDGEETDDETLARGIEQGPVNATIPGVVSSNSSNRPTHKASLIAPKPPKDFRTQVETLLARTRHISSSANETIGRFLVKVKTGIEDIPVRAPQSLNDAERHLLKSHKVTIPFPQPRPTKAVLYKFGYSKPAGINVVGSYAVKTISPAVDGHLTIDLVVHMPTELFETKDYLNHRYFHKRAYYLACIAAGLQRSLAGTATLRYSHFHDNDLLPSLILSPSQPTEGTDDGTYSINVMLAVQEGFFEVSKTLPNRNCIRKSSATSEEQHVTQDPTPFYNASVRADSSVNAYLKLQHGAATRCDGFRGACVLGTIWLERRGLATSISAGGFGRFELASLMALLLDSGGPKGKAVLSAAYNSLQLFGATLHFLAYRDLIKVPLILDGSDEMKSDACPMVFDGARGMNILYKMTSASYEGLRREAQQSTKIFGGSSPSRFDSLFSINVAKPLLRYDLIFEVSNGAGHSQPRDSIQPDKIYDVLRRGLGDRIAHLNITQSTQKPWPVNSTRTPGVGHDLTLCVILDAANASRAVDRGPAPENATEIERFRDFWAGKAELRRFKDGDIRESLVWDSYGSLDLTREIVLFLMKRHFGSAVTIQPRVNAQALNELISRKSPSSDRHPKSPSLLAAYKAIESDIRSLGDMPLQIRQMEPTGVRLRNTAMSKTYLEDDSVLPVDVVVQFESSNRWPEDLVAVQATKIAFLLKMCDLLQGSASVRHARVGLENDGQEILNRAFLDVHHSGEWFRARIHHEREQSLIDRRLADKSATPRQRETAALALAEFKRVFRFGTVQAHAMQRLATEFPSFSDTARMLKAWFNRHLLGNHFREELIEIFAAKTYLDPQPWPVPSSALTGFLRSLSILSRWDWQHEPMVVDMSHGSMKAADTAAVQTKFVAWRQIDPLMNRVALFVATNDDMDGATWTTHSPAKIVAARMTGLAKAAIKMVEAKSLDLNLSFLLKPSLAEYDFVIRLKRKKDENGSTEEPQYKNLQREPGLNLKAVGFDPVQLLVDDLQKAYGDCAIFFADLQQGGIVAGLWSPQAQRRRWKVNIGWSTIPSSANGEGDCEAFLNKDAMLAEMARLGGDLIESITPASQSRPALA